MGLERYVVETNGIVDELHSLFRSNQRYFTLPSRGIALEDILEPDEELVEKASIFLGKTPSQQQKAIDSLASKGDTQGFCALLLTAMALGELAAAAMNMAERMTYIPGAGYRKAARQVGYSMYRSPLSYDRCIKNVVGRYFGDR